MRREEEEGEEEEREVEVRGEREVEFLSASFAKISVPFVRYGRPHTYSLEIIRVRTNQRHNYSHTYNHRKSIITVLSVDILLRKYASSLPCLTICSMDMTASGFVHVRV